MTPIFVSYSGLRACGGRPLYIFSPRLIVYFGYANRGPDQA
jgi:hypothetical protein